MSRLHLLAADASPGLRAGRQTCFLLLGRWRPVRAARGAENRTYAGAPAKQCSDYPQIVLGSSSLGRGPAGRVSLCYYSAALASCLEELIRRGGGNNSRFSSGWTGCAVGRADVYRVGYHIFVWLAMPKIGARV